MVEREDRDGVVVVRMARGKGNALSTDFLLALVDALGEVEASNARAAVLTGQGKIFCAGMDLTAILEGGAAYVQGALAALSEFCERLAKFPKPVVAAVNGHAIAGGCIGLMACDYRILARGRARVGLTELAVGVAFPTWPMEIARFALPSVQLEEAMYTAATYQPEAALERGFVDELADAEQVVERAVEVADQMGSVPGEVFRHTKTQIRGPMFERVEARRAIDDGIAQSIWCAESTRERIAAFVAKTVKAGAG